MASRAVSYWRAVASRAGAAAERRFATATLPKAKPVAAQAQDFVAHDNPKSWVLKGEFAPVSVVLGMILVAVSFAAHTAKQQLVNSPGVSVRKKRREMIQEVEDPDRVAGQADRFINKSVFRKVAHVQDFDKVRAGISDPTRPNPFDHPRTIESLKSVGVNPSAH